MRIPGAKSRINRRGAPTRARNLRRFYRASLISRSNDALEDRNASRVRPSWIKKDWLDDGNENSVREECIQLRSLVPSVSTTLPETIILRRKGDVIEILRVRLPLPFYFLRHGGLSTPCQPFRAFTAQDGPLTKSIPDEQ